VPRTVKLSRQFHERLGDEVTDELVTLLNSVDEACRHEFRDLFAAHFGRLEARMGEFEARTDARLQAMRADLLRWMFVFWVGTMGTVVALLKL
jgi:hypothetical protein